jgi:serine/threonine protein kinase HipA of HipAB toxin-antitoxin module
MAALRSLNNQFKPFTTPFDPPHGESVVQVEGCAEAVKAWSEIGRGCRDVHDHFLTDARLRHR